MRTRPAEADARPLLGCTDRRVPGRTSFCTRCTRNQSQALQHVPAQAMRRLFPMSDSPTAQIQGWIERLNRGDESALDEMILSFEKRFARLASKMLRDF